MAWFFGPKHKKNDMRDLAMIMGVFMAGYLLTMGLLYVILSLFSKRDRGINGLMNISGNSKSGIEVIQNMEKSGKMKLANG
jgi:hypothetical protein